MTAMLEILEQKPLVMRRLDDQDDEVKVRTGLKKWLSFVGRKIREARKLAELTQEELCAKAGLPQSHISRLESGLHSPSRATLEKIATALNLPLSHFDPSAE